MYIYIYIFNLHFTLFPPRFRFKPPNQRVVASALAGAEGTQSGLTGRPGLGWPNEKCVVRNR